jgi:hypothetical protein
MYIFSLAYSASDVTLALQFSATSPLPRPLSQHTSTQGRSHMNSGENVSFRLTAIAFSADVFQSGSSATPPSTFASRIPHPSSWWPVRGGHAQPRIVDVPLAQAKEARSVHFLILFKV